MCEDINQKPAQSVNLVKMVQNEGECHLASPVAIRHDMKKVVDIMGFEILNSRTLPASFITENEVFKYSRKLPQPDGLKLEKGSNSVEMLTSAGAAFAAELSTRNGSSVYECVTPTDRSAVNQRSSEMKGQYSSEKSIVQDIQKPTPIRDTLGDQVMSN